MSDTHKQAPKHPMFLWGDWMETMNHWMAYQNQWMSTPLNNQTKVAPISSMDLNAEQKNMINEMSNQYMTHLQQMMNYSLDQFSIASEWSERATHVMQKSMGLKTIDS